MNAPKPDPRCPKCGYTMCELFDYMTAAPDVLAVTPNGKYQCYRCTPVSASEAPTDDADLLGAMKALLSYTVACEGLLNASPAGQVIAARAAITRAEGR